MDIITTVMSKTQKIKENEPLQKASLFSHIKVIMLLILLCIACYSNSIENSFHYDDTSSIINNTSIRTLNPAGIWSENNKNRFIGFSSFAVNHHFSGLNNYQSWHITNLILHISCVIMIYVIFTLIVKDHLKHKSRLPIILSLLFSVHPLLSESVNYIAARHVFFCTFFSLSGLLFTILFIKSAKSFKKYFCFTGIILSLFLGGLSKEVGVFYGPVTIILYLFLFKREKLPAFTFSTTFSLIPFVIIGILLTPFQKIAAQFPHMSFAYFLTQTKMFWKYVLLLIPSGKLLNVDHHASLVSLESPLVLATSLIFFLLTVAFALLAWKQRTKRPLFSFFSFLSIAGLLPYMLVHSSTEYFVEYRIYYSAIGFMGIISLFLLSVPDIFKKYFSKKLANRIAFSFFILFLALCFLETRKRNMVWKNNLTLWSDSVLKNPNNFRAHFNLANALAKDNHPKQAIQHYEISLKLKPDEFKTMSNLGSALVKTGEKAEAVKWLEKALQIKPSDIKSHNNLGNICYELGQRQKAIFHYKKVLDLQPDFAETHYNLGVLLKQYGKRQEADYHFNKAIELKPELKKYIK